MNRWQTIAGLVLAAYGAAAGAAHVALIEIDGPIGPATSTHFEKAQAQAIERDAIAIVLRLDTPGGLDSAMRDIIKRVLASPVPVIGWVGPEGARAASAGTYILYATHLAAMAPATNLGAATPIPIGGSWPLPDAKPEQPDEPAGGDGQADDRPGPAAEPAQAQDAAQAKALNDAIAYIRGLAEKRGRNADWAETAVREGASLSAQQALERGVIELVAGDIDALLAAADRRVVATAAGDVRLATAGATVERLEPGWRIELLAVLTNPTVAYVLMLVGIYGLLLEGYNPGAILPGVAGAICLLLALYAFQLLPVNYVGLGLILLGIALMIAETTVPSFGVLGMGGAVAFVLGSVLLMDVDVPGYAVNIGVIAGIAVSAAGLLGATLFLLWRSRRARVVTGESGMLGQSAEALEAIDREGWVEINGERWRARTARPLRAGQKARVVGREGLRLEVEPIE